MDIFRGTGLASLYILVDRHIVHSLTVTRGLLSEGLIWTYLVHLQVQKVKKVPSLSLYGMHFFAETAENTHCCCLSSLVDPPPYLILSLKKKNHQWDMGSQNWKKKYWKIKKPLWTNPLTTALLPEWYHYLLTTHMCVAPAHTHTQPSLLSTCICVVHNSED